MKRKLISKLNIIKLGTLNKNVFLSNIITQFEESDEVGFEILALVING